MEDHIASLLYGLRAPRGAPSFVDTILGRKNFATPPVMPIRAGMDPQLIAQFDSLLTAITAPNNASQNAAIGYALDHFFTLIRGPPGTGKSPTD